MFKAKDVRCGLCNKGFVEDRRRDHCYFFFHHRGRKTNIYTKISHGATDLSNSLCSAMARQVRLSGPRFHDFMVCPYSQEDYTNHLIGSGHLNPE